MSIPKFKNFILPFLQYLDDENEHSIREIEEGLAEKFNLNENELIQTTPSGGMTIFSNRVGWAGTYLKKAGLAEKPRRAFYKITHEGQEVLRSNPSLIDSNFLGKFASFQEFQNGERKREVDDLENTPEEIMESNYQSIIKELQNELLSNLKSQSPIFFEQLVVDLLIKMGYGGSRKDAGKAIGKSKDGGIDGIINEDKLGLDNIYIQAKRWEGCVGRPEIMKFVGALAAKHARKGIFITTSKFSSDALDYVRTLDVKIILIDGERLTKLMTDHNVGVQTVVAYEIKKIDSDYF